MNFDLVFFSCIYVTKLAEFLHGVAFVFLEERCYSIEDTRFFLFCSLPRKKWTLHAEIQEGPFSILFKNPARPIIFLYTHVEIMLLNLVYPNSPTPIIFLVLCPWAYPHSLSQNSHPSAKPVFSSLSPKSPPLIKKD